MDSPDLHWGTWLTWAYMSRKILGMGRCWAEVLESMKIWDGNAFGPGPIAAV